MSRTRIGFASLSLALALFSAGARSTPGQQAEGVPDSRHGMRVAPLLLLTRADVQADLRLSAEQVAGARTTVERLFARAQALKGQPDTPATVAARREIDQAMTEWLTTSLSTEQQARLRQIDLQWEGPCAIVSRGAVATALGITDQQRKSLEKPYLELQAHRAKGKPTAEMEQALDRKVESVLTPTQKELWAALLGPPLASATAARKAPEGRQ